MTHGTNGYDKQRLEALLAEVDDADNRLATLKSEYMESCKGPRNDIAAVFEAAKEQGVPVKAFRTYVANRRLEKSKNRNVQKLDLAQQSEYEMLRDALGDYGSTPLGAATLQRAEAEAALDELAQQPA
jgi:uncharacterized protein (UPF0335 family)